MMGAKQTIPCGDCDDGYCTMNCGPAIRCQRCLDSGRITVRNYYPMTYVAAGDPPEGARGVTGAWCDCGARP